MVKFLIKYTLFCSLLLTIFLQSALAADISARVDRSTIGLNESFHLIITLKNKASNVTPNFVPLYKNFQILSTSNSSQLNVINGKTTAQTEWVVTLLPKHVGKITIPSLEIGKNKSPEVLIQVNKSTPAAHRKADEKNIFITATATPKNPFIQSEIIYTIKIYFALNLQSASLSEPKVQDAIVKRLGNDATFQTSHDGKLYTVIQRRYVILPQSSGKLHITPPVFIGQVIDPSSYFGNFNKLIQTNGLRAVQLTAPAVNVEVKPAVKNIQGPWLPTSKLTIKQDWSASPNQLTVGTPITRTISVTAEGISGEQIPTINSGTLKNINTYPDQPIIKTVNSGDSIVGIRQDKIALVPTKTGTITLPAIQVHWFNTKTQKPQTSTLPAQTIKITTAKTTTTQPTTAAPVKTTSQPPANTQTTHSNYWAWIAGLLLLIWVVTMLLWWLQRHKKNHAIDVTIKKVSSLKEARKAIKIACFANDSHAAQTALIQWANFNWQHKQFLNLSELADAIQNDAFKNALRALDKLLYAHENANWNGEKYWLLIEKYLRKPDAPNLNKASPLPDLHP